MWEIIVATIGAAVGAILTPVFQDAYEKRSARLYEQKFALVNPQGRWKCEWLRQDGTVYVSDSVEIEGWTKKGRFRGKGIQPNLVYTLEGEIDGTRVMALTYRTVDFPTKAYVGVACMSFDIDGKALGGYWYGRASNGEFLGGATYWTRQ